MTQPAPPASQRGYPTATAAVQAQLASAFYSAQALLAAMATRDIIAIWQQMDLRDIRSSWPAIRTALAHLIEAQFGMSAAQAASYYAQAREAAGVPGPAPVFRLPPSIPSPFSLLPQPIPAAAPPLPSLTGGLPSPLPAAAAPPPVVSVPPPSPPLIGATLDSTGPYGLLGRIRQAQPLEQAAENTAVVMSGAASRLISNGARQVVLEAVAADPQAVAWMRVTAANPCAFCAMLASRVDYKSEQSAGFKAHNHCVPAGTLVQGPATETAYRRWHEGELVIVGTAAGHELAITPNHPVLTTQGWVPAGLLGVGDQVLSSLSAQWSAPDDPDEQQRPALIEDVWGALGVGSPVSMPVAAEDFHGDGTEGEVEVVGTYRLFPDGIKAPFPQPRPEPVLMQAAAWRMPGTLASFSDAPSRRLSAGAAPDGGMSSGGLGSALFGSQCGHAPEHDVALSVALDAVLAQHAGYHAPGNAECPGEGQFGLSGLIAGADFSLGHVSPVVGRAATSRTRYDPPAFESETQRLRIHTDLGRRLAERLAGRIQVSRVSELRRIGFAGHVYNLSTAEGWYEAAGIIVSNCRCVAAPVFSKEDAELLRDNDLYQQWKQVTRGYSKKDALNAWRRYWDAKMGRDGIRVLPAA